MLQDAVGSVRLLPHAQGMSPVHPVFLGSVTRLGFVSEPEDTGCSAHGSVSSFPACSPIYWTGPIAGRLTSNENL